jgi:hypothetical protein
VSGRFILTDRRDSGRLAFSFAVPKFSAEATRATIEISPVSGGCELFLTHESVFADCQVLTT